MWLFLFGGVGTIVVCAFLWLNQARFAEGLETIGTDTVSFVLAIGFLAVLALVAGVGFWLGRRWGWWAGTFYLLYSVARNVNAAFTAFDLANDGIAWSGRQSPEYYVAKHGIRAAIHLAIYLYLFRGKVREYFGVRDQSVVRVVLIEVGVCVAIFLVWAIAN